MRGGCGQEDRQLDRGVAVAEAREGAFPGGEQLLDRGPEPHRREDADRRERRVAPAHVHRVVEHRAKPAFAGQARERRTRLGDRYEAAAGPLRQGGVDPLPHDLQQRRGLRGRARLADRDDGERRRFEPAQRLADAVGVGGVERDQVAARRRAVRRPQHLGCEAGAAHAEQDKGPRSVAGEGGDEPLQLRQLAAGAVGKVEPPQAASGAGGGGVPPQGAVAGRHPLRGAGGVQAVAGGVGPGTQRVRHARRDRRPAAGGDGGLHPRGHRRDAVAEVRHHFGAGRRGAEPVQADDLPVADPAVPPLSAPGLDRHAQGVARAEHARVLVRLALASEQLEGRGRDDAGRNAARLQLLAHRERQRELGAGADQHDLRRAAAGLGADVGAAGHGARRGAAGAPAASAG